MNIGQPCEGCYFLKNKQCSLGRLDKFAQNGAVIEERNGQPFIKGRFCSTFRKPEWAKNKQKNNTEIVVRAEVLIRTDVLVYFTKLNLEKLKKTIDSLKGQILKPSTVVLICN